VSILYTRGLPDPDLVVRTSGEMRLSNFLLWQLAYAEIYVTQTLWPDFRGVQLLEGIEEFQKRERRYGGLGEDHEHAPSARTPRRSVDQARCYGGCSHSSCSFPGTEGSTVCDGDRGRGGGAAGGRGIHKLAALYGVQPLWRRHTAMSCSSSLRHCRFTNRVPLVETTAMIYGLALAVAVAPFVFLTIAVRRAELASGYPAAAASVFAFTYIAIPMALLVQIRQQPAGAILVIYTLLVVWAGDIFAYFVGKAIGRHRMSPEISPKKTWEGAVASVLASVVVGTLWFSTQRGSAPGSSSRADRAADGMFGLQQPSLGVIVALSAIVILRRS